MANNLIILHLSIEDYSRKNDRHQGLLVVAKTLTESKLEPLLYSRCVFIEEKKAIMLLI